MISYCDWIPAPGLRRGRLRRNDGHLPYLVIPAEPVPDPDPGVAISGIDNTRGEKGIKRTSQALAI